MIMLPLPPPSVLCRERNGAFSLLSSDHSAFALTEERRRLSCRCPLPGRTRPGRRRQGSSGQEKDALRPAAAVRRHNGHLPLFQWREIGRSVKLTTVVKPERRSAAVSAAEHRLECPRQAASRPQGRLAGVCVHSGHRPSAS